MLEDAAGHRGGVLNKVKGKGDDTIEYSAQVYVRIPHAHMYGKDA